MDAEASTQRRHAGQEACLAGGSHLSTILRFRRLAFLSQVTGAAAKNHRAYVPKNSSQGHITSRPTLIEEKRS